MKISVLLKETITYGLKGLAAYLHHANVLNHEDEDVDAFIQRALSDIQKKDISVDGLVALTLETGKYGVQGMALLDTANTDTYGQPEITEVDLGTRSNPGILISGHDLKDLEMLLDQTAGTGVDVFNHGEMLPGHYYPFFKSIRILPATMAMLGGSSAMNSKLQWSDPDDNKLHRTSERQLQGASVDDRGCPVSGLPSYRRGCRWIEKDFSAIIEQAKSCSAPTEIESGKIVGGFAHNQVLALADKVVDAVKNGAIKKFIVMAGCDGRHTTRDYYTQFAKALPKDTVILTAGCAKYRYNKLKLGDIGGIPRVLDAGQCNDSYSLALIALKLKEVFGLDDVNKLPIVYNIAWYEQKAVIVLLALPEPRRQEYSPGTHTACLPQQECC